MIHARCASDRFLPASPCRVRQTKLNATQRAAEQATKAHAAAEAGLRNASAELERVGQAAGLAEATLNHALSELRQVIPGADLGVDDDTLMAPLATASGTAAEAHQRQADEASQLAGQAELAAAEIRARRREFSQRSDRLAERRESVRERKESGETAAGELPAGYQVNAPLTAGNLADASERVRHRRTELTEISRRLEQTRTVIDQVGRDLETLNGQLKADVDAPARQLVLQLSAAEQRLNDLATLLAMPSAPARPSGSLADDAVWARELRAVTDGTLTRAQATITTLQQQDTEANAAISEL